MEILIHNTTISWKSILTLLLYWKITKCLQIATGCVAGQTQQYKLVQTKTYHWIKSRVKYDVTVVRDGERITVDSELNRHDNDGTLRSASTRD